MYIHDLLICKNGFKFKTFSARFFCSRDISKHLVFSDFLEYSSFNRRQIALAVNLAVSKKKAQDNNTRAAESDENCGNGEVVVWVYSELGEYISEHT